MLNLILILVGLISNPANSNVSTGGNDGNTTTQTQQAAPGDTGGDLGQTPKK